MARAYSQDLRERVIGAAAKGLPARQAAARFGIGVATAIVWVRRWRESGERVAHRQGQPKGSKLDAHEVFLLGLVKHTPDITLEEMRVRLIAERGVKAGIGTLWRFFDARGWSFKKNGARRRTRTHGRR
jgi:transposase